MSSGNYIKQRITQVALALSVAGNAGSAPPSVPVQATTINTSLLQAVDDPQRHAESLKTIADNLQSGTYIELTPKLAANYEELANYAKENGYRGEPKIYLDNVNKKSTPHIFMLGAPEGTPRVVANFAALKITTEYVKRFMKLTEADVKPYTPARKAGVPALLLKKVAELSKKQGLDSPPELYVDMNDKDDFASVTSFVTADTGRKIILMSPSKLKQPFEVILGSISHENEHFLNGDMEDAKYAAANNERSFSRSIEKAADRGAKHLCRPGALADSLEIAAAANVKRIMGREPGLSEEEARQKAGAVAEYDEHPSYVERIKAIREMPENTPGCISVPGSKPRR